MGVTERELSGVDVRRILVQKEAEISGG